MSKTPSQAPHASSLRCGITLVCHAAPCAVQLQAQGLLPTTGHPSKEDWLQALQLRFPLIQRGYSQVSTVQVKAARTRSNRDWGW